MDLLPSLPRDRNRSQLHNYTDPNPKMTVPSKNKVLQKAGESSNQTVTLPINSVPDSEQVSATGTEEATFYSR